VPLGERRDANGHLVQVIHRAYWPSEMLPCLVHERLHVAALVQSDGNG
jgi:hypothetical protein